MSAIVHVYVDYANELKGLHFPTLSLENFNFIMIIKPIEYDIVWYMCDGWTNLVGSHPTNFIVKKKHHRARCP